MKMSTTTNGDRREHDPDEDHVRIGELILADDRRRLDAEAATTSTKIARIKTRSMAKLPLPNLVGNNVERGR